MAFTEAVYLVMDRRGVLKMYKNTPPLSRGQIAVKLVIQANDEAFREPTMVHEINVTDPFGGVPFDVEFSQPYITEAEAEAIRLRRRQQLIDLLTADGYTVKPPERSEDDVFHDGTG